MRDSVRIKMNVSCHQDLCKKDRAEEICTQISAAAAESSWTYEQVISLNEQRSSPAFPMFPCFYVPPEFSGMDDPASCCAAVAASGLSNGVQLISTAFQLLLFTFIHLQKKYIMLISYESTAIWHVNC